MMLRMFVMLCMLYCVSLSVCVFMLMVFLLMFVLFDGWLYIVCGVWSFYVLLCVFDGKGD